MRTKAPSEKTLSMLMERIRDYVFPEYYDGSSEDSVREVVYSLYSNDIAVRFMESLPEISRLVRSDACAVLNNDPAASDLAEVVYCYPAVKVMLHHRTAHELYSLGVPVHPRMISEMAHSATGIDINPAAVIGESFAIDHGTGIVIGETAIIGNNVTLYQGVTLGAKNFRYDNDGHPVNIPRHPVIEDNVTVYSNTSILGRVTIGHDTIIGGNVWLTHDVPPHSKILQSRAIIGSSFTDGAGI